MIFIDEILKRSAEFALRGSNVRVELFIPQDLWPVAIDEGQVGQAIHNVVINAQQAMEKGGVVELRAENVIITREEEKEVAIKSGEYLKITVKDSGPGIPNEFLRQVFDPYFTTRLRGARLWASRRICNYQRARGAYFRCLGNWERGNLFDFSSGVPKSHSFF